MTRSEQALADYTALRHGGHSSRLAEAGASPKKSPSELSLQADFYAGRFGLSWKGLDGEVIEAIHLGAWNREPGPDFVGARLRVDSREIVGDIELDREDGDWERHGHGANPSFNRVAIHAVFRVASKRVFIRTSENRAVPQVLLAETSSPHQRIERPPTPPPRMDTLEKTLEGAVRFRLAVKRERWLKAEALHGLPEALFQAVASALGYKNNAIPFLLLAQRIGLERARDSEGEAMLFGLAGFLEAARFDAAGEDARSYARELWNTWWLQRGQHERLILPKSAWTFPAGRPANHPHRRVGALALIARSFSALEKSFRAADLSAFLTFFRRLEHPFWRGRASLDGRPLQTPFALVGEDRAVEMAANLLAPAVAADPGLALLRQLRCVNTNAKVRRALAWLGLPQEYARPLTKTAFGQQALLQLYEDFFPQNPQEFLPGHSWET